MRRLCALAMLAQGNCNSWLKTAAMRITLMRLVCSSNSSSTGSRRDQINFDLHAIRYLLLHDHDQCILLCMA